MKYSIKYTTDNTPVVVIEENILDGVPKSKWIETIKNTISTKFSNGIPVSGRLIKVNADSRNEFTKSKYSKYIRTADGTIYADRYKSANNLDEIVLASTNYINEDLKHERKDNFKEFARGNVLIRVIENDYSAKVIIGFTTGNNMVLYDIIDFTPTAFDMKKENTSWDYANVQEVQEDDVSSNNNKIPQNNSDVNTYSMQESEKDSSNDEKFSLAENIDHYDERSYNKYGWAYVNKVLDNKESGAFFSKIAEIKNGTPYNITTTGDYIIPVGSKFGVNNVLIFTDGNFNNPSIEKIIRIDLDNETDIEEVRDFIYEKERNFALSDRAWTNLYKNEPIESYSRETFGTYTEVREQRRNGKAANRNSKLEQDRGRNDTEGEQSEIEKKFSLKEHQDMIAEHNEILEENEHLRELVKILQEEMHITNGHTLGVAGKNMAKIAPTFVRTFS